MDVIPEARLNLVIYYLKQGNVHEAYELMKDVDPSQPNEYILKAVVNAVVGQDNNTVSFYYNFIFRLYFQIEGFNINSNL